MPSPMTNKQILARLYNAIKPYRPQLFLSMFGMVMVALLTAGQTYLVKDLIDKIFIAKNETWLLILVLVIITIFGVKGIFYYSYTYILEKVGLSIIKDFRTDIFRHLHIQPLSFFNAFPTGTLISRILSDITLIQHAVSSALIAILKDLCTVVALLAMVFYLNWRIALFCFVVLPIAAYPIIRFSKIFRKLSTKAQEETAHVSNILHETITGNRIVKAFNMEEYENSRYVKQLDSLFGVTTRDARYRCLQHPIMEFIGGGALALFIWFGGREVINQTTSPGTFFTLMTALFVAYEPIKKISRVNSTIQQGLAAATRVYAIMDIKPAIADQPGATTLPPLKEIIEFKNVSFSYAQNNTALHDISFTVPRGQNVAIVGQSGGGKTTLTNLIPRFLEVTAGQILIDSKDIREVTMKSLRDQIAMVTQQTILFNDTVRNNISYGSLERSEDEIKKAAQAANAYRFIMSLSNGFDTIIGESGARLSGGERQRISIARALLKNAPILILDEATSALDTESEREVQDALETLMKNRTTFVIAHRLSTIINAHRIIVIKQGRIVEDGTHEALLALHGEYEFLYKMQHH